MSARVEPARRRSWPARLALALLAVLLGGCAWLYGWPPTGQPHDTGPVVVLGGGAGDRLDLGLELIEASAEPRELVLSAGADREWAQMGGSCGDEGVRCLEPAPANTFEEATAVSRLAERHRWEAVTVVTSEYHVTRTRMLFSFCMQAPTRVVASDSPASLGERANHLVREPMATLLSLPAFRYCPAPG